MSAFEWVTEVMQYLEQILVGADGKKDDELAQMAHHHKGIFSAIHSILYQNRYWLMEGGVLIKAIVREVSVI